MQPEPIVMDDIPPAIKKLLACLDALGMSPGTFNGGPDSVLAFGKRDDARLAVQARYVIGTTPGGKVSAKFAGAKVHDPVGIVQNLEANYYYGVQQIKQQHMLPKYAEKVGQERSAKYNDGAQWSKTIATFETASEMNGWLDEWLDVLKIDHKKQSAAKKEKPNDLELMNGSDWIG